MLEKRWRRSFIGFGFAFFVFTVFTTAREANRGAPNSFGVVFGGIFVKCASELFFVGKDGGARSCVAIQLSLGRWVGWRLQYLPFSPLLDIGLVEKKRFGGSGCRVRRAEVVVVRHRCGVCRYEREGGISQSRAGGLEI